MTTREILRNGQRARWEWTRRLGLYKYIVLFGVLAYGLPHVFSDDVFRESKPTADTVRAFHRLFSGSLALHRHLRQSADMAIVRKEVSRKWHR